MKLKHSLSMVLLAIGSVFRLGAREECHNVASTVGTHENGKVTYYAQTSAITLRYALVKKGTADNQITLGDATTRPLGVVLDEPGIDEAAAVAILGSTPGTVKMVASKAITAGAPVYTAAGGKVTDAYGATAFIVGRALTSAGADGDLIEVAHCFPMINAAATL
jgi:hypothetical protein